MAGGRDMVFLFLFLDGTLLGSSKGSRNTSCVIEMALDGQVERVRLMMGTAFETLVFR